MRPGRFDRQVVVKLPDVRGREGILKVHAKNVKLMPDVDLSIIARGTPGYSGAELANLLNEAALLAARLNKKAVGMEELEEARDKVRWGRERRSLAMTDEEKKSTAWHEAGHALVNDARTHASAAQGHDHSARAVAGLTTQLPEKDILIRCRKEMFDYIAVTMGDALPRKSCPAVFNGAAMDIQQATNMARAMVCQYGMSDKVGMVQYGITEKMKDDIVAARGQTGSERDQPDVVEHDLDRRAVFADWGFVLVFLHPPDQDGRQGRLELRQKQGADAREGTEQNHVQGRGGH